MPEQFLHGVEVIEIDDGARPIRTVRSSVIGLIGTAAQADAAKFPLNTPVLIAGSRKQAAGLGKTGTLPAAIDAIFDQAGALIVVVRVKAENDRAKATANIIGGIDDKTGAYLGVQALLAAQSVVGVAPRLLIAPGFTQDKAVVAEMVSIARRLRGVIIADGPNSNDAAALEYRKNFGSDRVYLVDPWVQVSIRPQPNRPCVRLRRGLPASLPGPTPRGASGGRPPIAPSTASPAPRARSISPSATLIPAPTCLTKKRSRPSSARTAIGSGAIAPAHPTQSMPSSMSGAPPI